MACRRSLVTFSLCLLALVMLAAPIQVESYGPIKKFVLLSPINPFPSLKTPTPIAKCLFYPYIYIERTVLLRNLNSTVSYPPIQLADAQTGVCYGMLGSSLPQASQVINLYKQNNIRRMRLYDPNNKAALQALGGSGIEVMVGVPNINDLQFVAANQANAISWVQNNILKYPNVNFKYIAVGNEVSPRKSDTSKYVSYVVPAMRNIQNAISTAGLSGKIKVSTSVEMGLTDNTYPPSSGVFRSDVRQYVNDIVQFLLKNNSPLLVNIYPYFALAGQPSIGLDYALFRSAGINTPDGRYQNLFHAMLDAVYAALEKIGAPNMQIVVSETGWPTEGGHETTVDNARTYNSNLIQRVKNGSPRRPGRAIETYIFAMFDENQKGGDAVERHFGIFSPNQQAKYSLNFN